MTRGGIWTPQGCPNKSVMAQKYQDWINKDGLLRIEGWCRDGLIDVQIAHNMGIALGTLLMWKKKYPELAEVMKRGKDVADREVENALFNKAVKGNVTAQIFWLKNRKPDDWRNFSEKNTRQDQQEQATRIERMMLENEKLRAEIDQIRKQTAEDAADDGFLDALSSTAAEDWSEEDA